MRHDHRECIRQCWMCSHSCQETLFDHCLPTGGAHAEEGHVKLMTDCIEICQVAGDFMTRESMHHPSLCQLCAEICDSCAESCEEFGDPIMRRCAEQCRACAKACRDMARAHRNAA